MFGFGGGFNGPGGGSTNSGSSPSGKSNDGKSPSERNAQGKEGTNSGPGNPGHTSSTDGHEGTTSGPGNPGHSPSTSGGSPAGGKEYSGYGSHEGQTSGPGNPGASGSAPGKGDRVGGSYSVGNVDPARFGGSTPTGFSPDIDPTRFGGALSTPTTDRVARGFGAAMGATTAEIDRAAQARADERTSMNTYDSAARTREDNARMADLAATRRAAEDRSMTTYDAATKLSEANAQRADTASTVRAAENTSMNPFHEALANFLGITRKAEAGTLNPYDRVVAGKKGTPDYADISSMTINEAAAYAASLTGKPSHVVGGYQFKDTTLTGIADEMGIPRDTKMTPAVQSQLAVGLAQRRANQATVNGKVDVDKFARELSKEWASFSTAATGTSFYSKNGLDKASVSYGDVRAMAQGLVDTGVVGPRRSLNTMGDDPSLTASATGTVPTATRFASTYLGKEIGPTGYDPAKNPANERVAAMFDSPEQGDQAAPQQASYTPDPSLTEFPDRPRTGFEKVAAAGLDIGAGMIPGIGLGVGLINGGLSLTGNRTIGTRIVDAIATGKGGKGAPIKGDPQREYQVADTTIPVTTHTTVPTVDKFVDSYLSPPDATKYPTPYQKYDLGRDSYAGA